MKIDDKAINRTIDSMSVEELSGQLNMFGGSIYSEFDAIGQMDFVKRGQIGSMMYMDPKTNNVLQRSNLETADGKAPIIFASDVIHGAGTMFPVPLAESCSWEPELARRTAEMAAFEGSALGLRWTFAPMVDIYRDSRWGRVIEGAGEDPYLGSCFAKARVKGFQGDDPEHIDSHHLAATAKHFVCYGFVEQGRDYNRVSISESDKELAFRPFKSAIDAGVSSIMTSMNDINGIPVSCDKSLLQDTLRKRFGFDGVIVSDYGNVRQAINQKYSKDQMDAVKDCFEAGTDIDMESRLYMKCLPELVKSNRINRKSLESSVKRVLMLKKKTGLLDSPYVDEGRKATDIGTDSALSLSYEAALKSIVMLKNDGTLPIANKKMALIGSFADDRETMNGGWSYPAMLNKTITILEGLRDSVGSYVDGYDNLDEIIKASSDNDVVVFVIGTCPHRTGEATSMSDLRVEEGQRKAFDAAAASGKPIVLLVLSARPLVLTELVGKSNSILYLWGLGTMGGKAVSDIVLGKISPSAKTTITFPKATGQCPIYYQQYQSPRPHNPNDFYTTGFIDNGMDPLFPFGFGLSYNHYSYSRFAIDKDRYLESDQIVIRLSIANEGNYPSSDIVQCYVSKDYSKPIRPNLELAGFLKAELKAHEEKEFELSVKVGDFMHSIGDNKGTYSLSLRSDSATVLYETKIEII